MSTIEDLERERDAWKELAEALAETAMGRDVGYVTSLPRLRRAKERLRALGIEPPKEPEVE